ncbi:hypothetical protein NC651_007077 [Populus alba x Populus x berolinensis]|nr:hypothetical protein NC651_007077 [Populus alba x Populus x berolinensis]
MKVQILARKLITPSSPTPLNLQKLKISCLDQNFPSNLYTSCIFYYPASGRYVKGSVFIDCNDNGAEYLEAKASGCLSEFLKEGELETELRNHLAPPVFQPEEGPLLVVQFNMFECGGLAIGISVTHQIVDGFTLFTFVDAWATACRIGIDKVHSPSFQLSSFCPPKDMSSINNLFSPRMGKRDNTIVEKRIVFNGADLSSLKAAAHVNVNNSGSLKYEPSRVQVVTAFIWRALIKASQARHGCLCPSYLTHVVDMRRRTALPIPGNLCGNFGTTSIAQFIPVGFQFMKQILVGKG